jgi:hypothetical protein
MATKPADKPLKVVAETVGDVLKEMDQCAEANMRLWNAVCRTDPKHTKPVEFGRKFTAIDAHYQIQEATRLFGPVGEGWGYDTGEIVFADGLVIVPVTLWHGDRGKTFGPIYGSTTLRDRKGNIDKDAPKKATTDALTKALSQLGFNADVFLGKFDDNKYVEEVRAEFAANDEKHREKTKLDGPYDTLPKLEKAAREFARTLRGMGSLSDFEEWKKDADVIAFVDQCKRDLPGWWFANHPECPPDFTPLAVEVASTRRGLAEIEEMETTR